MTPGRDSRRLGARLWLPGGTCSPGCLLHGIHRHHRQTPSGLSGGRAGHPFPESLDWLTALRAQVLSTGATVDEDEHGDRFRLAVTVTDADLFLGHYASLASWTTFPAGAVNILLPRKSLSLRAWSSFIPRYFSVCVTDW
jgi:hypothetical protein